MNWLDIVKMVLPIVLSQVPKLAPITNEVTAGVIEAEQLKGAGTGPEKLAHVVSIAKNAAQATDELRGSADDVAGNVGSIVNVAIPLVNEIAKQVSK